MTGTRKLCWAAAGTAAALLCAHYCLPLAWQPAAAVGLLVLGLAALLLRKWLGTALGLLCLFAGAGFLWNWGHYQLFVAPADALAGREERVEALVLDYPVSYDRYDRLRVRLCQEGLPRATVYVYDYERTLSQARPGDKVKLDARFFSAMTSAGEETDSYLSSGVYVRAAVQGGAEVTGRWRFSFLLWPRELARLVGRQVERCFPEDTVPFMTALLTGDKQALYGDSAVYTSLRVAGLSHVVAISGMHVAFLVGAVRLWTGRRRRTAFLCLPLIVLFMAMAGFTPSVLRAGIMQILLLLAPILRREYDPPTGLAAALLLLLLGNPQAVGSVSLQLSFAAMAGITLLTPRIYAWMPSGGWTRRALPRALLAAAASSLGALVFTVPLTALHFGCVPLYAVLSNMLGLWAVSAAFVLGYGVCLTGLVWGAAGSFLGSLTAWLPRWLFWLSRLVSRLPYAALYTEDKRLAWWLLFVYAVFLTAYLTKGKGKLRPVIPLCVCVMGLAAVSLLQRDAVPEGCLTVAAVDVGQGQSIAVLQENSAVVIDCGSMSLSGAGERTAAYLAEQGKTRIDLLVLTHLHADHANGVLTLMERVEVERLALPRDADDAGYTQPIVDRAEELGTEVYYVEQDSYVTLGELELTLYAPLGKSDANERGVMVLGSFGENDFLVTGDADSGTESLLTAFYDLPDIELLVVGHHGSRYSTCTELLDETSPDVAFISVGYNTYGHPHETVLQRLAQYGVEVYRTDQDGTISMTVGKQNG